MLCHIGVETPVNLSPGQRNQLKEFADSLGERNHLDDDSSKKKTRNFFG